eukprot:SM000345S12843  [mRNA]  locus=s345:61719:64405:- [translate_table: standard]
MSGGRGLRRRCPRAHLLPLFRKKARGQELAVFGPALAAAFPASSHLTLQYCYGPHVHGPPYDDLCLLSDISTLSDLRIRLVGEDAALQCRFRALHMLSNVVRELSIGNAGFMLPLADIASFTALKSLALTKTQATDADIHNIAASCRQLTGLELRLHQDFGALSAARQTRLTDAGLESIAHYMPQLRKFHIEYWCSITDSGIRQVALGCPLLQDISVQDCYNLSVQSAHAFIEACRELRRLQLHQSWSNQWLQPQQTGYFNISRLEQVELHMPDDATLTITAMATLASSCPQLHELHVHTDHYPKSNVSRPDPLEPCPAMPALVKLTMKGFHLKMTSFAAFLVSAPQLEHLSLKSCELVGAMQALPAKTSLRSLNSFLLRIGPTVNFWKFGTWCPNVTSLEILSRRKGKSVVSSLAGCSRLVNLHIESYYPFHNKVLPWTCPSLDTLRVLSCFNNVHSQDLAALARASPQLQEVHLTECRYTDKEAILDLLASCSQLDYIRVMCCPKLSQKAMTALNLESMFC